METITNAASSVVNTASSLIYGQPAKNAETETKSNETGGKEPLSGEQGKGTIAEPFDQGNKENAADVNTTSGQDDFLKLNPTIGKPTETLSEPTTGTAGENKLPIIPLSEDTASTEASAIAGTSDKVWKPTPLDEVKPEGAPGAGPPAPEFTPATPDLSSASKTDEPAVKDTKPSESTHDESLPKTETSSKPASQGPVGGDIDKILQSVPKSERTVPDEQASDPHSKMTGTTIRQTDASQHGESANSKSLADEKTATKTESHGSVDRTTSPSDEKSGKKMSHLKEKLKDKLHIGSKDK